MISAYNLKEIRQLHNLTQEEFAAALGLTREMINKMEKGKLPVSKATNVLLQKFTDDRKSENFSHEVSLINPAVERNSFSTPYYVQRREQKTEKTPAYVPLLGVKAQAGYVKSYEQVDTYMNTLEKYSLPPGVKGEGAQWCYFEIEGDSMEPTFSASDIILASMVHAEDWSELRNFYVYVILTGDSLLVKRVFRKSPAEWVLISDNEEGYPQRLLQVSDIKEIWVFRRHIHAKARVPKMFEITV